MSSPNQMTDRELMEALLASSKKSSLLQTVTALGIFLVLILLLCASLILIPKTLSLVDSLSAAAEKAGNASDDLHAMLSDAEILLEDAKGSLEKIDVMVEGIDTMVGRVDDLLIANTDTITEVAEKLNNIDFDTLNKAISELETVVRPLSEFFGRFGGN